MYNFKANKVVEGGYKLLINMFMKLSKGRVKKWTRYLYVVFFIDWTFVYKPLRYTLFYLVYGREAVLLVKIRYSTWRTFV